MHKLYSGKVLDWKNLFSGKFVLPLIMYFDDYENNNPLESHAGVAKCGAVYLSIACLPTEFQSKLENIFFFVLFNSLDRKQFKNKVIFDKVMQELRFMWTDGISIIYKNSAKNIFSWCLL